MRECYWRRGAVSWFAVASLCFGMAACSGSDGAKSDEGNGSGGSEGTSAEGGGSCEWRELFAPFSEASKNDMVRTIHYDEASGDLYFATLVGLYRFAAGATEPEQIAEGHFLNDIGGKSFWLKDNSFIFSANAAGGASLSSSVVLSKMPKSGGAIEAGLRYPDQSADNVYYSAFQVRVVGDDVYWLETRRQPLDSLDPRAETMHVDSVRKSTIHELEVNETTTHVLYVAPDEYELGWLRAAGGPVFVNQSLAQDDGSSVEQQLQLDPVSGAVIDQDTRASKGFIVEWGDGDWWLAELLGEGQTLSASDDGGFNVFETTVVRMRPDASEQDVLDSNSHIEGFMWAAAFDEFDAEGELWAWLDLDDDNLYSQRPGEEKTLLGCLDPNSGWSAHALEIGADTVYLSVYDDTETTILEFPLQ